MPADAPSDDHKVEILTCSTASDYDLFAPLAESIDRYVAPDVVHMVVVPRVDLKLFEPLGNARRRIIAQEDILPYRLWKSPTFLKALAPLRAGFRRPFYLTSKGHVVRGWMLQQYLKIEMTRRSKAAAVLHVDSDVCFVRPFKAEDAFRSGKVTFFRVEGETRNPKHRAWVEGSCAFLGQIAPDNHKAHYIENCVLWSSEVVRQMVSMIEGAQSKPLIEVIFGSNTMSEYYLYGLFADLFPGEADLAVEEVSYCNSFWPARQDSEVSVDKFVKRLQPKHCAVAIQSTHQVDLADRLRLYRELESALNQ